MSPTRLYLAGPMRRLPAFNFPAFDEARTNLRHAGYEVFSPATRDRFAGFEPDGLSGHEDLDELGFDLREAYAADLEWIVHRADGIALLDGWESSSGASAEAAVAHALGIPTRLVGEWLDRGEVGAPIPDEEPDVEAGLEARRVAQVAAAVRTPPRYPNLTILEEAAAATSGPRQEDYGHPAEDFARTGRLWSAILGQPVSPDEVGLCMVALKVSRLVNTPGHRDSLVDLAGYARTLEMIQDRRS